MPKFEFEIFFLFATSLKSVIKGRWEFEHPTTHSYGVLWKLIRQPNLVGDGYNKYPSQALCFDPQNFLTEAGTSSLVGVGECMWGLKGQVSCTRRVCWRLGKCRRRVGRDQRTSMSEKWVDSQVIVLLVISGKQIFLGNLKFMPLWGPFMSILACQLLNLITNSRHDPDLCSNTT